MNTTHVRAMRKSSPGKGRSTREGRRDTGGGRGQAHRAAGATADARSSRFSPLTLDGTYLSSVASKPCCRSQRRRAASMRRLHRCPAATRCSRGSDHCGRHSSSVPAAAAAAAPCGAGAGASAASWLPSSRLRFWLPPCPRVAAEAPPMAAARDAAGAPSSCSFCPSPAASSCPSSPSSSASLAPKPAGASWPHSAQPAGSAEAGGAGARAARAGE
jgi:hypothetical protein